MQPNRLKHYCPDKSVLGNPQLSYHILEDHFIKLIQDRRYSVSQRLVALGHILGHLIAGNSPQGDDVLQICKSMPKSNEYHCVEPDWNWHLKQLYVMSNIFLKKFPSLAISQLLRSILLALSPVKLQQTESSERIIC